MRSTMANPETSDHHSIFTAVTEQLGLKLESAKGPVEVIVIDRMGGPPRTRSGRIKSEKSPSVTRRDRFH